MSDRRPFFRDTPINYNFIIPHTPMLENPSAKFIITPSENNVPPSHILGEGMNPPPPGFYKDQHNLFTAPFLGFNEHNHKPFSLSFSFGQAFMPPAFHFMGPALPVSSANLPAVPEHSLPSGQGMSPSLVLHLLRNESYKVLEIMTDIELKKHGALPDPEAAEGICPHRVKAAMEKYTDEIYAGKTKFEARRKAFEPLKLIAEVKKEDVMVEKALREKLDLSTMDTEFIAEIDSVFAMAPTIRDPQTPQSGISFHCDPEEGIDPQCILAALDRRVWATSELLSFATKALARYGELTDPAQAEGVCPSIVIDTFKAGYKEYKDRMMLDEVASIFDQLYLYAENKLERDMDVSLAQEMLAPFTPEA